MKLLVTVELVVNVNDDLTKFKAAEQVADILERQPMVETVLESKVKRVLCKPESPTQYSLGLK